MTSSHFVRGILTTFALTLCGTTMSFARQNGVTAHNETPPKEDGSAPSTKHVDVYDEHADAKTQIAEAVTRAKKDNKRVLIQWGGNWCIWCTRLHNLYAANKDLAHELLYEYEVVYIDTGVPKGKNVDVANSYGAQVEKDGFPYLTILDDDGKVVANHDTGSLETKEKDAAPGHDPRLVLDVLKKNEAPQIDAQRALDGALAKAKSEHKRVFLHFRAPWCGWCKRLEAWMDQDDVKAILAKDFIDLRIDQDRMIGGKDLKPRFGADETSGIPWFAFLDENGKALADSVSAKGNIGFPQAPEELAHFEDMLKKASQSMTSDDIAVLLTSLHGQHKDANAAQ
ncbi:MAG TPA: thioredoxin family protein [Phycisphaerales bacterium]|nr:thioredoxin family protein [Phycisphaerales bacterium]